MQARPHIDRHYEEELRELRDRVLRMGGLVEKQVVDSVRALVERDADLARATIARDAAVNEMDLEIDEHCLRLLALHQPTASDLRFIATAMKINADLERAGDMAVNVCERAVELCHDPELKTIIDLARMAAMTREMLQDSLNAFVREDVELAQRVCRADEAVDDLLRMTFETLTATMIEDPESVRRAMGVIFVAKYLERVADHATNVARAVQFMVTGKTIRHREELDEQ